MSIAMARMAFADGTRYIAATPHYMPGMYDTDRAHVVKTLDQLRKALSANGIQLAVYEGGDVHVTTGLVDKLRSGTVPTLNGTRYFLFEPPHHVVPPKLVETAKTLLNAGFVPILTHPERLTWIEKRYDLVCELDELGVPIQLTAGSITGDFGSRAKRWSDRMILEGRVDIIASDAHNTASRPPGLSSAVQILLDMIGEAETHRITQANPAHILRNEILQPKQRVKMPVDESKKGKPTTWSLSTVKDAVFGKKK